MVVVLLMLMIMYLILGSIFDTVAAMVITLPFVYPVIMDMGYDPVWWGVVNVMIMEIGMITPPVCVGIYTAAGVIKEDPSRAFKEVPLFVGVGIFYGILMILLPITATWLPNLLR